MQLANDVRRERTRDEVVRLGQSMSEWIDRRRKSDGAHHVTQLDTVQKVLRGASEALAAEVLRLDTTKETGAFHDACRDIDLATAWLQRIWHFHREKFDQRDDPQTRALLNGADEIIWSIYKPALDRYGGAAPLPYIVPEYSPGAIEAERPMPAPLRLEVDFPEWDDDLKRLVGTLQLPLLCLPPWCIAAPWWLVYIGHELGHHTQSGLGAIGAFREGLKTAVAPFVPADAARWGAWGEEIFADAFAVFSLGRWAVWSMAEVERTAPPSLIRPRQRYPSPAVRLAIMAGVADALRIRGSDLLDPAMANAANDAATRAAVGAVVNFVLQFAADAQIFGMLDLGANRIEAADKAPAFELQVQHWRAALLANPKVPAASLQGAREIASGAVAAWHDLAALDEAPRRPSTTAMLKTATLEALVASGLPGTRGGTWIDPADAATLLARGLRDAGRRWRSEGGG